MERILFVVALHLDGRLDRRVAFVRTLHDDTPSGRYSDHGYRSRRPSAQEQLAASRMSSGRGLRGGAGNRKIPELAAGDRVSHDAWGMGTVVDTRGSGDGLQAQVDFGDGTGVKWLMPRYAPLEKL